jgi:hypothetical protein
MADTSGILLTGETEKYLVEKQKHLEKKKNLVEKQKYLEEKPLAVTVQISRIPHNKLDHD